MENKKEFQGEYLEKVTLANKASQAYYDNDEPIMSDVEFDALMNEIKAYEKETGIIADDSPTQRVGGSAGKSTFEKLTHAVPMLSLQDYFNIGDVKGFLEQQGEYEKYRVEEKIDGLSLSVTYENGELTRAETRGDGYIGEDVTENAKFIRGIPRYLAGETDGLETLEVRFEVFLFVKRFLEINKEREASGKKLFANPRNAAAGLLRTKDIEAVKSAELCAYAFNVQRFEAAFSDPAYEFGKSHTKDMCLLNRMGISVVPGYTVLKEDVPRCIKTIGETKNALPYWIDGAVVKIDSIERRKALGETNKYPRWAIAYKYPPEEKETVIRDILLQTGRTGRVTPVAVFDPVFLGGTKVEKATLNNPQFIMGLDINIGDTVLVRKAAEIIPQIIRVTNKTSRTCYDMLAQRCPSCGGALIADEDGNGCYCPNENCPAQLSRKFEFWASRDCMDIRGMGPAIIDKLIEKGLLKNVPDIYRLKNKPFELSALLGEKTANNLLKSIEESKDRDIDRFIKALGIPGVGRTIGKKLAQLYPTLYEIGEIPMGAGGCEKKLAEFSAIEGVGDICAKMLVDYFNNHENWEFIIALVQLGVNVKSKSYAAGGKPAGDSALAGKTFVITGTLPNMTREEATQFIESNGGTVSSSVSKKTNFLVCGENAGSKLEKAKALGVTIIDEAGLEGMV